MLTRREFNRRLVSGMAGAAVAGPLAAQEAQQAEEPAVLCRATLINGQRLRASLEELARFGRLPEGGLPAGQAGTSRVGFSRADLEAHHWLMGQLRDEGLEVMIDAAANSRARRAGDRDDLPALWFGSHIDTVPHGGNFDGCVGSLSALEVMRSFNEKGIRTRHPLELVIFSNEEGVHYGKGLFGSRALVGELEAGELDDVDAQGVRLAEWIRRYGGDPDRIPTMTPRTETIHSYLELHIEQGATLWSRGLPLGIVEGIVGIKRYHVTLQGFPNHAGTTPMDQRRDALVAASKIVLAVRAIVTGEPGRQVGTVGRMEVHPGAPNVIPGLVRFPIELRDLSEEKIDRLAERIREQAAQLAAEEKVSFSMEFATSHEPALTDRRIRFHIQKAAEAMRAPALTMASGAGHDAQMMARLCPVGMIFVPSVEGISHAPREFSRWEEVACGCECLYRTLLRL
ncbi:MAG: Zn-dependent hydrolase, partial [Terriglobia bacterium]